LEGGTRGWPSRPSRPSARSARATLALVEKLVDEPGTWAPGGAGLGCQCAPEPGLCSVCEQGIRSEGLVFSGDTLVCRGCAEAAEAF
jgi:hypothetical protein